jgi:hypothetical protein
MCVDWTDPQFFAEAIRMLPLWRPPNPVDALELLEWKYAAPEVREYAGMWKTSLRFARFACSFSSWFYSSTFFQNPDVISFQLCV